MDDKKMAAQAGENDSRFDCLKIENQLCFPLYACSKEVVRRYKPYLDKLDLTYTQYITMMILWDERTTNVKELGRRLYLDSGTLTPLLKKLEGKGYLTRHRAKDDERNLVISLTDKGLALREQAADIPAQMGGCIPLERGEAAELYRLLYKILGGLEKTEDK